MKDILLISQIFYELCMKPLSRHMTIINKR